MESDVKGKSVDNLRVKEYSAGSVFHIDVGAQNKCWLVEIEDPKKGRVSKLNCWGRSRGSSAMKTAAVSGVSGIREIRVSSRAIRLGILEPIVAIYFMPKGSETEEGATA